MPGFKGHVVRLFLDRLLEMKLTDLRSDKKLGKSYAGLLCFIEGLNAMGYLSKKKYLAYQKRYSVPLTKDPEQALLEDVEQLKLEKNERALFGQVIEQFDLHKHKNKWLAFWQKKAVAAKDIPEAKQLLALIIEQEK